MVTFTEVVMGVGMVLFHCCNIETVRILRCVFTVVKMFILTCSDTGTN